MGEESLSADPDAIPLSSGPAIAYAREVEALGRAITAEPMELAYGPDRGQKLHVYTPGGKSDLPILLFFHGGAWINGHAGWLKFMAPAIMAMPAILVAGTYRLAPRCRWPAQMEDVTAALAFVREHAGAFGGDTHRIVVGGHSAGGHLASLLALRDTRGDLLACMPVSAPLDLRYGDVPIDSDAGRVYRHLFQDRSQDSEASPIVHVRSDAPPFHIVWGEEDLDRVRDSGVRMVQTLKESGAHVTHKIIPRSSHFDTHLALSKPQSDWYDHLGKFFVSRGGVLNGD